MNDLFCSCNFILELQDVRRENKDVTAQKIALQADMAGTVLKNVHAHIIFIVIPKKDVYKYMQVIIILHHIKNWRICVEQIFSFCYESSSLISWCLPVVTSILNFMILWTKIYNTLEKYHVIVLASV